MEAEIDLSLKLQQDNMIRIYQACFEMALLYIKSSTVIYFHYYRYRSHRVPQGLFRLFWQPLYRTSFHFHLLFCVFIGI